jgi:sec-independent protein translocase protein TatA
MFGLGMQELVIILFICVILFGAKKLPEIGSGIGKGITSFKKSIHDEGVKATTNDELTQPMNGEKG